LSKRRLTEMKVGDRCIRRNMGHVDWLTQTHCDHWFCDEEFQIEDIDGEPHYIFWDTGEVVMGDGSINHNFNSWLYEHYHREVNTQMLCAKCACQYIADQDYEDPDDDSLCEPHDSMS
jgi:hypothetical protein